MQEACKSGIAHHSQRSAPRSLQPRGPRSEFLHSFRTHLHFQSKMAIGIRNPRNPNKTNVQGGF